MREIMKRTVAAVMAVLIACAAAGCSSTGNSSSGSSSAGETTTTTAPVVEDMGNIDLSDVTTEYDVPEDFSYESEAEEGTLSGGAAVLDKNFLGKFSGDGFVSIGSSGDMAEFEIDFPAKGSYNITLTMAADGEGQSNLITVDGAALTNFTSTTTEFGDTVAENVLIDEGTHKIGIKGDNGHIYIDRIKITQLLLSTFHSMRYQISFQTLTLLTRQKDFITSLQTFTESILSQVSFQEITRARTAVSSRR